MVTEKINSAVERYSGEVYGRVLVGIYLSAAVIWMGLSVAGYPEAGFVAFLIIFGVGLVAGFAVHRSSVVVHDERDDELYRRASNTAFNIFGGGGFVVFVSLIALEFAGMYEMTPRVGTLFLAWSAFVLSWGVAYVYHKYMP